MSSSSFPASSSSSVPTSNSIQDDQKPQTTQKIQNTRITKGLQQCIRDLSHINAWEREPTFIEEMQTSTPILMIKEFTLGIKLQCTGDVEPRFLYHTELFGALCEEFKHAVKPGTYRPMVKWFIEVLKLAAVNTALIPSKLLRNMIRFTDDILNYKEEYDLANALETITEIRANSKSTNPNAKITQKITEFNKEFIGCEDEDKVDVLFKFIEYLLSEVNNLTRTREGQLQVRKLSKNLSTLINDVYYDDNIEQDEYDDLVKKIEIMSKFYSQL